MSLRKVLKKMKNILRNKYVLVALLLCIISTFSFTLVKLNVLSDDEQGDFFVVTSFYPVYIATINLTDGIGNVNVENLTKNVTGCLHDYQLSTKDLKMLSKADMLIMNGAGMEEFLADVPSQYDNLQTVTVTDGVELIAEDDEYNSHSWMDLRLYRQEVQNIANGLIRMDEKNADKYKSNLEKYLEKIDELIEEAGEINKKTSNAKIITFHDAFVYLENDFGFEVKQSVDMDENTALSAAEVGEIVDSVNSEEVKYLVSDEDEGKSAAEAIKQETNVKIIYLDPLVSGEAQKDAYINGMKANMQIIKEAFEDGQ